MTLEMRELKGDDLFTLLGIVGKLGIKDEFIQLFEQNVEETSAEKLAAIPQDHKEKKPTKAELEKLEKEKARLAREAERRGMEAMAGLMQKLLLNINKIKPDINALLADLTDASEDEIKDLNLIEYTTLIKDFFRKKELQDFFSSIASLLQ